MRVIYRLNANHPVLLAEYKCDIRIPRAGDYVRISFDNYHIPDWNHPLWNDTIISTCVAVDYVEYDYSRNPTSPEINVYVAVFSLNEGMWHKSQRPVP